MVYAIQISGHSRCNWWYCSRLLLVFVHGTLHGCVVNGHIYNTYMYSLFSIVLTYGRARHSIMEYVIIEQNITFAIFSTACCSSTGGKERVIGEVSMAPGAVGVDCKGKHRCGGRSSVSIDQFAEDGKKEPTHFDRPKSLATVRLWASS